MFLNAVPVEEKPKPKKGKIVKRFVTPIPLDNTGRPIFPIELGTLTVYCLGEVGTHSGLYMIMQYLYKSLAILQVNKLTLVLNEAC